MWSHNSEMITLYHYTTKQNALRIMKDGIIRKSEQDNRDAKCGSGVYLTDLAPYSKSKEVIARNNWGDGAARRKVELGHVDAAFKVKLSRKLVSPEKIGDRTIYVYRGDLRLPESAELILWDVDLDKPFEPIVGRLKASVWHDHPSSYPRQSRQTRQETTSDFSPWDLLKGLAIGAATIGAVGVVAAALTSDPDRKKSKKK